MLTFSFSISMNFHCHVPFYACHFRVYISVRILKSLLNFSMNIFIFDSSSMEAHSIGSTAHSSSSLSNATKSQWPALEIRIGAWKQTLVLSFTNANFLFKLCFNYKILNVWIWLYSFTSSHSLQKSNEWNSPAFSNESFIDHVCLLSARVPWESFSMYFLWRLSCKYTDLASASAECVSQALGTESTT